MSVQKPDRNLALELIRVTETAALAASPWVGRGQKDLADANTTAEKRAQIYKDQADKLKAMGDQQAADLAYEKAAQEESASAAEKFGDIMTKIKETAMKLVAPILDVVHGLMDGVLQGGGLMAAFDGVISVLKPIMEIVMGIGKVLFAVLIHPAKMLFSILILKPSFNGWCNSPLGPLTVTTLSAEILISTPAGILMIALPILDMFLFF